LTDDDFAAVAATRIARRLLGGPVLGVSLAAGGRNSRVYRVDAGTGIFALKQYPSLQDDPRDRLGVEAGALKWMAEQGLDMVPRLVATDPASNSALLSWADGSLVRDVGDSDVDQAVHFLAELHRRGRISGFPDCRLAAEACLSGAEIEKQIRTRVADLDRLRGEFALGAFLSGDFAAALQDSLAAARSLLSSAGLSFELELSPRRRSLVPSDFGFHNALRNEEGRLTFVDFEYFGWDDPVKLTADMLLHPGTAVAAELRSRLRSTAEKLYGDDPDFATRLRALYRLFGLRWVLILLNEFHPERWRRRVLAGASEDWAEAKDRQLGTARVMLTNLLA
jgi:hypothetical protein